MFRTLSADLGTLGDPFVLGSSAAASADIVWAEDRFVVVWDTKNVVPGPSIMGATLGSDGSVLLSERAVTAPASFARSQAVVSLGDRLLIAWAEEQNGSFDLFSKMLTKDLTDQSPPELVASGDSDSIGPALALGAFGAAAMVFSDDRSGSFQVYAVRLTCGP
jgi:hypothetical protein